MTAKIYDPTASWRNPQMPGNYTQPVGPNYKVRGEPNPGWVYDPNTDKYYPQAVWDIYQAKLKATQNGLKPPPGLGKTLVPIGAAVVTAELAREGGKAVIDAFTPSAAKTAVDAAAKTAANTTASAATNATAGNVVAQTGGDVAANTSIAQGLNPGADANSLTLGAQTGTDAAATTTADTAATGGGGLLTIGNGLSALATAKGAYDVAGGLQNGGQGLRPGLTELGAGIGGFGGPVGAVIGAGLGNLAGYGMQGNGIGNNLALMANPLTWPLEAAKLAGIPLIHQTTKQYEQKRWGMLSKDNIPGVDAAYQANHPQGDTGVWTDGPYKGQKWTFEKANELAKTTGAFNEALGNYEVDPKWGTYTPAQKLAITTQAAQSGLYEGDHGDVRINDKDAFTKIRDSVLASNPTGTATAATSSAVIPQPVVVQTAPPPPPTPVAASNVVQLPKPLGSIGTSPPAAQAPVTSIATPTYTPTYTPTGLLGVGTTAPAPGGFVNYTSTAPVNTNPAPVAAPTPAPSNTAVQRPYASNAQPGGFSALGNALGINQNLQPVNQGSQAVQTVKPVVQAAPAPAPAPQPQVVVQSLTPEQQRQQAINNFQIPNTGLLGIGAR